MAVTLHRDGEAFPEGRFGSEQAGVEKVHQRPEFAQAVLDRRAGEGHPGGGGKGPGRPRRLGGRVLDVLSLVERQAAPADPGQQVPVTGQEAVGGEHQVGLTGGLGEGGADLAGGAVVDVDGEAGGEALRFPLPVADQRHRADEQRRRRPTPAPAPRTFTFGQ